MCSRTVSRAGILSTTGLAVLLMWVFPALLWSQGVPRSQQPNSPVASPFSGFEEPLTKAADDILAAGSTRAPVAEAPSAMVAVQLDQPRSHNDRNVAQDARMRLLRPVIEPILHQSGVPVALAAVVLVESGGRAMALSPKGARGLWQLMPDTARRYGLRVDEIEDDRLDTEKSTRAASHYLSDLHLQFNSWTLAVAAYNTGERNVQRAINRSLSPQFNDLSSSGLLPLETRNYVPRVLAAMQLLGQPMALAEHNGAAVTQIIFAVSNR